MYLINNIYTQGLPKPKYHAAMYYKTEPLVRGIDYRHTNNWEIVKSIQILNSMGFVVDLIDRSNTSWNPQKKYDLFLGLGVGNTGKRFAEYARRSKANKKVLLAMGPQPDISNKRVIARYDAFQKRTGINAPPQRTVTDVIGPAFLEIIENTDYIFCIGELQTKSFQSMLGYDVPVLPFYPAVTNSVKFRSEWKTKRNLNEFLCFAGNGLICKGVDLLIEAFLHDQDKKLHICGPAEKALFDAYGQKIQASKNIEYHGFIAAGGETFNKLVSQCAWVIFHPSAEGCCTSVATAMKAGLVPIINSWTGIHVDNDVNGIIMSDDLDTAINEIHVAITQAAKYDYCQYELMLDASLKDSQRFSQESFVKSYTACIERVIHEG
jgi:glycosyltransferase involved in cell wall biosynthesis